MERGVHNKLRQREFVSTLSPSETALWRKRAISSGGLKLYNNIACDIKIAVLTTANTINTDFF